MIILHVMKITVYDNDDDKTTDNDSDSNDDKN